MKGLAEWWIGEKLFTKSEVSELLAKIKEFNAGVIDEHLNKHVEAVFEQWLESQK